MTSEAEAIEHGPSAVLFAIDCIRGALVVSFGHRLTEFMHRSKLTSAIDSAGAQATNHNKPARDRILAIGVMCSVVSVFLGVCFMLTAGAPFRLVVVNLGALIVGSGLCLWLASSLRSQEGRLIATTTALGALLLATSAFGLRADGAARWLKIAGLIVQPSLIVIPALLLIHAQNESRWTGLSLALAVVAVTLQPDRAMAGALAGTLVIVSITRRRRQDAGLALFALAGFAATLAQADNGSVSPFVDRILITSFAVHALAGASVVVGSLILMFPAFFSGWIMRDRSTSLAFGTVWGLIVIAAFVGNYPTPMVGYGGSAIVGYLLSVASLATAAMNEGRDRVPANFKPVSGDQGPKVGMIAAA